MRSCYKSGIPPIRQPRGLAKSVVPAPSPVNSRYSSGGWTPGILPVAKECETLNFIVWHDSVPRLKNPYVVMEKNCCLSRSLAVECVGRWRQLVGPTRFQTPTIIVFICGRNSSMTNSICDILRPTAHIPQGHGKSMRIAWRMALMLTKRMVNLLGSHLVQNQTPISLVQKSHQSLLSAHDHNYWSYQGHIISK